MSKVAQPTWMIFTYALGPLNTSRKWLGDVVLGLWWLCWPPSQPESTCSQLPTCVLPDSLKMGLKKLVPKLNKIKKYLSISNNQDLENRKHHPTSPSKFWRFCPPPRNRSWPLKAVTATPLHKASKTSATDTWGTTTAPPIVSSRFWHYHLHFLVICCS